MTRVIISARSAALCQNTTLPLSPLAEPFIKLIYYPETSKQLANVIRKRKTYRDVLHLGEQNPVRDFHHVVAKKFSSLAERPEKHDKTKLTPLLSLLSPGKGIEQLLIKHSLVHETDTVKINAVENKQAHLCVLKRRFLKHRQKRHGLSLESLSLC